MPDKSQETDDVVAETNDVQQDGDPSYATDDEITPGQFADQLAKNGDTWAFTGGGSASTGLAFGEIGTYAPDELRIDSEDIRNTAALGRQHIARIDELIVEMQNEMAASEVAWMGDAGAWYRDTFLTATNKFRKSLEDFADYTRELDSYADEYEGVDSRAQIIADSAEQPDY